MSVPSLRIAVVGGSLGGLTAALVLRDLGHDVTVYERSHVELEQRGAGIGLLPQTSRYLTERAGVAISEISIFTSHIRTLARDGRVLHDSLHDYRFSSWNTIYRRLLTVFGREHYLLGREVVRVDGLASDQATVCFDDGSAVDADLVVFADGVGSRFRSLLLPSVEAKYAGYVAWRGMVAEGDVFPHVRDRLGDAITYGIVANSHILVYPIPGVDGSVADGERLLNFVWYRNELPGTDLDDLLTGVEGKLSDLSLPPGQMRREHVDEMRATARARLAPEIADMVCAVEQPFLQVVYDVELPRMVFGRGVLLGDAAWVARPHAAAGTAKAAEDAWQLSDALARHDCVHDALIDWENRQLVLGAQLVERTRAIGRQSQFDCTWTPGNPEYIFGLYAPGQ